MHHRRPAIRARNPDLTRTGKSIHATSAWRVALIVEVCMAPSADADRQRVRARRACTDFGRRTRRMRKRHRLAEPKGRAVLLHCIADLKQTEATTQTRRRQTSNADPTQAHRRPNTDRMQHPPLRLDDKYLHRQRLSVFLHGEMSGCCLRWTNFRESVQRLAWTAGGVVVSRLK